MKRVLVTGASGFLGGRLCHALLDRGYHVRAFIWHKETNLSSLPSPPAGSAGALELAYGDVTDLPSLLQACSGCVAVFHVAALVDAWHPNPRLFMSINVGGLKNVVKACKQTKTVERIIYTSSFFAIGPTDGYVADETQVHGQKSFCTEYEKSKVIADGIALQAASEGVPVVLVYPGVMYGPGNITAGNVVVRTIMERFNGRLPGYVGTGYDRFSFSHVDDVAVGHIAALREGRLGERYLLTGENTSLNKILDSAAAISGTKRPSISIPLWLAEGYGWLSLLVYRVTGIFPFITPPSVRTLRHQWAYCCEKAKRELDYDPRSLEDGLAELLPWLKNQGHISY
uniref:NAD-dependent epimerase/dehydratase domain-containing protein n=1 Tax=Kalanchoe fedtschenkoi TaxID=63787 RepID=A0A7N0TEF8_KALFE